MLVRRLNRPLDLVLRNDKSYHHNHFKLNSSLIESLQPIIEPLVKRFEFQQFRYFHCCSRLHKVLLRLHINFLTLN